MMALLFLCAIYIIIYPHIIAPNQAKTEDEPAESSSYEKVENAAEVITGTDEAATSAAEVAIAAIEEKEKISASATYSFRSDEKLRSHFEKHGHEMGFLSLCVSGVTAACYYKTRYQRQKFAFFHIVSSILVIVV